MGAMHPDVLSLSAKGEPAGVRDTALAADQ
jgi:hypothetical protein